MRSNDRRVALGAMLAALAAPIQAGAPGAAYPVPSGKPSAHGPAPHAPPPPVSGEATTAAAAPDAMPPMPPPRYDSVGYAVVSGEPGPVAAAHATLPPGSFAEVTALDSGRTILLPITAAAPAGQEIALSAAAAQELGISGRAGVRVRMANATGSDRAAFDAGRAAPARPLTPPVLLVPLRKKLGGTLGRIDPPAPPTAIAAAAPPSRTPSPIADAPRHTPAPKPAEKPAAAPPPPARVSAAAPIAKPAAAPPSAKPAAVPPRRTGSFFVQVAALGDAGRAKGLADKVGGTVVGGGGFHRVRLGPFDDRAAAQVARDGIARRGYGDARIVRQD